LVELTSTFAEKFSLDLNLVESLFIDHVGVVVGDVVGERLATGEAGSDLAFDADMALLVLVESPFVDVLEDLDFAGSEELPQGVFFELDVFVDALSQPFLEFLDLFEVPGVVLAFLPLLQIKAVLHLLLQN